jgi:hypothetical protein
MEYQLEINNPTNKEQDVVLFGFNKYLLKLNFGSSIKVIIKPTKNKNYLDILKKSADKPCNISIIRVITNNDIQNKNEIILEKLTSEKKTEYRSIYTKDSIKFNDYNKRCFDIDCNILLSGNTALKFKISPKTKICYTFF